MRSIVGNLFHHWRMRRDPVGFASSLGVRVGSDCRLLGLQRTTFGSEPYLVRLGDHVTVSAGVRFVTHDGGVWVFRDLHPDLDVFAPITVGTNVFIGANAMILKGVSIGDNCVIGAGSVVTRSIPAGSVVAGCPARHIKTIDEYWAGIQSTAISVRDLPKARKRRVLERYFFGSVLR